jgi:hypothetical protein
MVRVNSRIIIVRAFSAAVHAVNAVMTGYGRPTGDADHNTHNSKAFIIGRPPGHHAGPNGCVKYFYQSAIVTNEGIGVLSRIITGSGQICRHPDSAC